MARAHIIALLVWEVCVLGLLVALKELSGNHVWGKDDLGWVVAVFVCGVVVVASIAALCRNLGKVGGLITGFLCGLVPSLGVIAWVFVARPGFEESAGGMGLALILAGPSCVGGAVAGILCSRHNSAAAAA